MLAAIRQWVIKTMMKDQTGVVRTLPKREIIEMNTQITAERIMRNGINPEDLKTVGQVENVVNQIDTPKVNVNPGITSIKKADVFDIDGNKIPEGSKIMGGKEMKPIKQGDAITSENFGSSQFAPDNQYGFGRNRESDAAMKARLDADNKKGIASMKKKLDDPEEKADGGRIGLKGGTFLNFLKKFKVKKSGDDVKEFLSKRQFMKDIVGNTEKAKKARELRMLKEAMEEARKNPGFKFKDVDVEKDIKPIFDQSKDRTLNSEGGRIGYKVGSVDKIRRLILKAMGAGTVGIGAAKSGIFSGLGKGAGKTVAKEVTQQTTSSMPPPYFFKLAEKIKKMGTDVTATTDRTISKTLLSKDGQSEYILEQDIVSGNTLIKKVYKEEDMITNVEIMSFTKGEDVVTKKGKAIKTPDEYEEVTETNSRVYKDNFNDPDYEDGINVDEIIKEVDDQAPPIKYASGGLAYMLGE